MMKAICRFANRPKALPDPRKRRSELSHPEQLCRSSCAILRIFEPTRLRTVKVTQGYPLAVQGIGAASQPYLYIAALRYSAALSSWRCRESRYTTSSESIMALIERHADWHSSIAMVDGIALPCLEIQTIPETNGHEILAPGLGRLG